MKTNTLLLVAGGIGLALYLTRRGPFAGPRFGMDESQAAQDAMNAASAKRSRLEKGARGAAGALTSIIESAWPQGS